MSEDDKQDAYSWLEANDEPEAQKALELLGEFESRENTVLGMLMARRPHTEIRDWVLSAVSA